MLWDFSFDFFDFLDTLSSVKIPIIFGKMMDFLQAVLLFVELHNNIAYIILFFGAFLESTFPVNFFIYGEIFFLAGAILSGLDILNIFIVAPVLIMGGIFGDSMSYYVGCRYGHKILNYIFAHKKLGKILDQKKYEKVCVFFQKYGGYAVFLGRFGGPISRITPFTAGILKLKYSQFIKYNIPGVIGGIGLFIIVGYFFGKNFESILSIIFKYIFILFLIGILLFIILFYVKKYIFTKKYLKFFEVEKRKMLKYCLKHVVLIASLLFFVYAIILYLVFFRFSGHSQKSIKMLDFNYKISNISQMQKFDFQNYFMDSPNAIIQPINMIVITKKDLSETLKEMGWVQNRMFVSNTIKFKDFLHLYKTKELPVTNLFFSGFVQNSAFQIPSESNLKRIHLRIWNFGMYNDKKIYLISISKDKKIDLEFYNYFITPIHEIEQNVDKQRNLLLRQFQDHYPIVIHQEKWNLMNNLNYEYHYTSDGFISIIEL